MVFLFVLAPEIFARCARLRHQSRRSGGLDSVCGGGPRLSRRRRFVELVVASEAKRKFFAQTGAGGRRICDALCDVDSARLGGVVHRSFQPRIFRTSMVVDAGDDFADRPFSQESHRHGGGVGGNERGDGRGGAGTIGGIFIGPRFQLRAGADYRRLAACRGFFDFVRCDPVHPGAAHRSASNRALSRNEAHHSIPAIQRLMGLRARMSAAPASTGRMPMRKYCHDIWSTASVRNSPAIKPAIKLPSDAARNHVPINCPTNRRGASLVTELKPTGLKQSSPSVWMKYVATSQLGPALCPVATSFAAPAMTTNPTASKSNPTPNFTGSDGFKGRRPRKSHIAATSGARLMMNTAPSDRNQLAGISN